MTGLLAPTTGEVIVAGHTVSPDNIDLRRVIGILPEDPALFHSLTIWESFGLNTSAELDRYAILPLRGKEVHRPAAREATGWDAVLGLSQWFQLAMSWSTTRRLVSSEARSAKEDWLHWRDL